MTATDFGATAAASAGSDFTEVLTRHLRGIRERFEDGELAFLAATRKVEDPIRDKVAWRLHNELGSEAVSSREFPLGGRQRADLAVLRGGVTQAVVEFKALYAFDVHSEKKRTKYREAVRADLARASKWAPQAEAYAVVLTTHVAGTIRPDLARVVKYAPGIRGAMTRLGTANTVHTQALDIWGRELATLGAPVTAVELDHGEVWGLDVILDAWLVGPVPRAQLGRGA